MDDSRLFHESNLATRQPRRASHHVVQATTSETCEGLAQGPYVAARVEFEPATFGRSFTPKIHRQQRVKDLLKVPTWWLERDSNPRPFGRKATNLLMSHHASRTYYFIHFLLLLLLHHHHLLLLLLLFFLSFSNPLHRFPLR